MRHRSHGSLLGVAVMLGLAASIPSTRAKELDCSKEVFSSADNLYCQQGRLDDDLEVLRAINAEISKLIHDTASDERRDTVVEELESAQRAWLEVAQKYCRAINAERGGARWPEFWITSCIRDEVRNRIHYLCAPDDQADPLKTCARASKMRPH